MKTIVLLCIWMCATAFADEQPPQIPPDLVQVKSGGQWEDSGKNGFVRFSAFERGFEHVRHQVVIEWIHVPDSPNESLAVASRIVIKDIPDVWVIGEATFVVKDGKTSIHFDATNTYLTEKRAKYSIEILSLGTVTVTAAE